jgi:hypothetical protein
MSGFIPLLSTVTAADVATAVRSNLAVELAMIPDIPTLAELQAAVLPVNVVEMVGQAMHGDGSEADKFRSTLVP